MKNILLFVICMTGMSAFAQSEKPLNVSPTDFTANPSKYDGKTINLVGIIVAPADPIKMNKMGMNCKAPEGTKPVTVIFRNDARFNKCFFVDETKLNPMRAVAITITGNVKDGYTIIGIPGPGK